MKNTGQKSCSHMLRHFCLALFAIIVGLVVFIAGILLVSGGCPPEAGAGRGYRGRPPAGLTRSDMDRIYARERAILKEYDKRDRESLDRLMSQIEYYFGGLKEGVPGFADEIYGIGSKIKIAGRLIGDKFAHWIKGDRDRREVENYVMEVWERHLFSPEEVNSELERLVADFINSLEVNRNLMAVDIAAELKQVSELRAAGIAIDGEKIRRTIEDRIRQSSAEQVRLGVGGELVSLAGGELAAYGVIKLINSMITSSAASVAAKAGTAGAGSSGAGASVAAVSGWWTLGIGLVLAVAIDFGVSRYSRRRMVRNLNEEIDRLQSIVLDGYGASPGLRVMMLRSLKAYREHKHSVVHSSLQEQLYGGRL